MTSQIKPPVIKADKDDNAQRVPVFWPVGFHGDGNLMRLVDILAARVTQFIETGTDSGSTVGYLARMYPHITCYSCETDKQTFEIAQLNLADHPKNVCLQHAHSMDFLAAWYLATVPSLFWLDAHSDGWGCKLDEELAIVLER